MATAGFLSQLGEDTREQGKEKRAQDLATKNKLRDTKADELETSIKNLQQRASLQPGQPGYISPDQLKPMLSEAQKQLTGLYTPEEGPHLLKRLKGLFPGQKQQQPTALQLKPGMTLDEVLAQSGPAPKEQAPGKTIGSPFPEGGKWYVMEETPQGDFTKKVLPGYNEETHLQELIRKGYSEDEAKKIMRIEGGLEAKAAPTRKGFKYDKANDEWVNEDTGERFNRQDVSNGIGGETVARLFRDLDTQTTKQDKKKEQAETTKFNRRLETQTHAFELAIQKGDHDKAQKIYDTAREQLTTARQRMNTMDKNKTDAQNGNQQAMLSLVANHIGMTLGAQRGARITRAVWDEAMESAPWLDIKIAKFFHTDPETGDHVFDGFKEGVTLTPDQINQMVDLAHQQVDTLQQHVQDVAGEFQGEVTPPKKKTGAAAPTGGSEEDPLGILPPKKPQ